MSGNRGATKRRWPLFARLGILAFAGVVVFLVIPELVRARYDRASNACVNNLRNIDGAKQQWFLENKDRINHEPTHADLQPYIGRDANSPFPVCPAGGDYIIGVEGATPRCTAAYAAWPMEHTLEGNSYSWWDNFKNAYMVLFGLRPEPYTGRKR